MQTIYRKSDLLCVGTVAQNMTAEQEITLNVLPNFGGVADDYAVIETDLQHFHLETIGGVVTVVEDILEPVTPEPTTADYLIDLDFRLSMIELGLS